VRTIGLDVHKRFAEVAILTGPGTAPTRRRIATSPAALRAFAGELGPDDQVVLEATMNTWAIAEVLATMAGRVVVSNPLRTRAIAEAKVKTDEVDALTLAQLLQADFIPAVWIPDPPTRTLRRKVSHRAALVRQRTSLRNQVHAVLHRNLIDAPWSDLFGQGGRGWLAALSLPEAERAELDASLRLLTPIDLEIDRADRALAVDALGDRRVELLMTVPGVGVATALSLVAVIGDIGRFPRPAKLVGYLGLDPKVRQSGERPARTGAISHQGSAHARGLCIEAAHSAVRLPGPLHAFYMRVHARRGGQKAIVAVARKLVVLAWHLLSRGEPYRWAPATLIHTKRRALERTAGIPAGARAANGAKDRERLEREILRQAEAAYTLLVAARRNEADAAAATGRDDTGQRPKMRGGATRPTLRSSLGGQAASAEQD